MSEGRIPYPYSSILPFSPSGITSMELTLWDVNDTMQQFPQQLAYPWDQDMVGRYNG